QLITECDCRVRSGRACSAALHCAVRHVVFLSWSAYSGFRIRQGSGYCVRAETRPDTVGTACAGCLPRPHTVSRNQDRLVADLANVEDLATYNRQDLPR